MATKLVREEGTVMCITASLYVYYWVSNTVIRPGLNSDSVVNNSVLLVVSLKVA